MTSSAGWCPKAPAAGGSPRPAIAVQHRMNAGIIVEQPLMDVRFKNGRKLGTVEEGFASTLSPGDHFFFAGLSLEVERIKDTDIIVHASSKSARIVTYGGQRMSMSTHLANRVRAHAVPTATTGTASPTTSANGSRCRRERSILPEPHQLLVETFPHEGRHYMVAYSFEGWNAHQSLGMLITKRMENAGLKPLGFVANDYGLACYGLEPISDPQGAVLARHPRARIRRLGRAVAICSRRAFREVAVIGGLVERHHPGKRKTGRQVSFSTDLIYDVLRRYEPEHLLLRAAWDDARARMTELGRLVRLVDRASATMVHVEADRITPMAVPLMVIVGREAAPPGAADESAADRGRSARRGSDAARLSSFPVKPTPAKACPMRVLILLVLPLALSRLRRRHRRRDRGRCRHLAGQGRLEGRRCRHHQPVGSRREARPRAAQGRGKGRQARRGDGREALPQGAGARRALPAAARRPPT